LVNDAFCSIFSLLKNDIIGKTLAEDVSPDEKERFLKIDKQVLSTGIENITEETLTVRGGETKLISTKKTRYVDERGNKFLIGIIRDITARKNAEKQLAESEMTLRTTLDRVTDGFVALDKNWCYTYMNKKAGEIFNRDPEQMIGKNIWEEFPEGIGQPFHKAYEKAMREQIYIHFDEHYPPYNKWFENHIYPSPEGLSIYFSDVSKRKIAERELAESENRLRTILENEPECVKLLDKNGSVIEMNPAGLQMIEADNLEIIKGKKVLQIINEPYRKAFADLIKKVFEGESGKLEFEITGLKGGYRFLETHAVPFKNPTGQIINLLGVTRDVTDRRKAEQKIIQLNKELEQRVKERTAELETANLELQEINELFVGREARIIELKEELEALKTNGSLK